VADTLLFSLLLIQLGEILCQLFIAILLAGRDLRVARFYLLVFPWCGELLDWEGVFDAELGHLKLTRLFLRVDLFPAPLPTVHVFELT